MRISTARMPPRMKKTKAVTMKRLPTVLWLTLVSWPQKPGGLLQVFSSAARSCSSTVSSARAASTARAPSGGGGGAASVCSLTPSSFLFLRLCTRISPASLQALQVVEQRLQVCGLKDVLRHAVAGLDLLRVHDPAREVPARILQSARGDGRPAREVRQVGADRAARVRPPDAVAHHAWRRHEDLPAARLLRGRRLGGGLELVVVPSLELLGAFDHDRERHVRVLVA